MDLLLHLLLWKDAIGSGRIEGLRLPRCDTPGGVLLFLAALVLGMLLIRWAYRRDAGWVTAGRKRLLAGCRIGALVVLLFIASGAFVEVASRFDGVGTVMVLVDRSRSMALVDAGATTSRHDQMLAAIREPLRRLGGSYQVETFGFGESPTLAPLDLAQSTAPAERATQLGAALADARRRAKGRRLDAVIVASDGGWNRGEDPVAAARELGAPVVAIGVGAPQAKDLEIPFLSCEDTVFKGDRLTLDVRVRQRGFAGRTARLVVHQIDAAGRDEVVKEDALPLGEDREFVHPVELLPDREGVFSYAAELQPQPEEANTVNNRKARANVQVVDHKLRVLLVDDAPRWEYRFIRGVLDADRNRVQATCILRQGEHAPLAAWKDYDCVILGDIGPDVFTSAELTGLESWVRAEAGGLIVVAGRRRMPFDWSGSVLDRLLPVEPDPQPAPSVADELARSLTEGVRPQVTPEGQRWSALRFSHDPAENEQLWHEATPLLWTAPVRRLKSGATALLVHPTRRAGDDRLPILAVQRYGRGQVAWLGSDETWRWRFKPGAVQHRRLWGQLASSLGMAHLLGNSSRVQIESDRSEYAVGDQAQLIARVLDADFNPLRADAITATVERELGRESVALAARRDQPGMFTGTWTPGAPGRVRVVVTAGDASDERQLNVSEPQLERDDGGMREDLLRAIAQASGGVFLPLADAATAAEFISGRERPTEQKHGELTLWNAPGILVLLVLLLGVEWWFRKRWDML